MKDVFIKGEIRIRMYGMYASTYASRLIHMVTANLPIQKSTVTHVVHVQGCRDRLGVGQA